VRRPTGSVAERVASRIAGTNRGNRDGRSIPDLAEQEGVTVAYACRLLPLTCLAPDIVEAILGGRANHALMLERLWRTLTCCASCGARRQPSPPVKVPR
jgi:hypothetical protein